MYGRHNEDIWSMLGRLTRYILQFTLITVLTVKLTDFNAARFVPNGGFEICVTIFVSTAQAFFYTRNVFKLVSWIYNNWGSLLFELNELFDKIVFGYTQEDDQKIRRF